MAFLLNVRDTVTNVHIEVCLLYLLKKKWFAGISGKWLFPKKLESSALVSFFYGLFTLYTRKSSGFKE